MQLLSKFRRPHGDGEGGGGSRLQAPLIADLLRKVRDRRRTHMYPRIIGVGSEKINPWIR